MAKRTACNKVSHLSERRAKDALHALLRSGRPVGLMDTFWCPRCQAWHVGTVRGTRETKRLRLIDRIDRALRADARKRATPPQDTHP